MELQDRTCRAAGPTGSSWTLSCHQLWVAPQVSPPIAGPSGATENLWLDPQVALLLAPQLRAVPALARASRARGAGSGTCWRYWRGARACLLCNQLARGAGMAAGPASSATNLWEVLQPTCERCWHGHETCLPCNQPRRVCRKPLPVSRHSSPGSADGSLYRHNVPH